jgi:hypothetical protein
VSSWLDEFNKAIAGTAQVSGYTTAVGPRYKINWETKLKTITFTVDDKKYSIETENSILGLKRVREIAGLDSEEPIYRFDNDGDTVESYTAIQSGAVLYSETYLDEA